MDIASACLAGIRCRYDKESRENADIKALYLKKKIKAVCPECLAGLKIPRTPSEICGGDGYGVLNGTAKVLAKDGSDRTAEFIKGARMTLKAAKRCGAKRAFMKSKSPSCALSAIYDGTFTEKLRPGCGVTSALLLKNGIEVIEV